MNKLVILLIAIGSLLSGCIAYEAPYGEHSRDGGHDRMERDRDHDRDHARDRDRDGDGIRDRDDRRPDDPRRY